VLGEPGVYSLLGLGDCLLEYYPCVLADGPALKLVDRVLWASAVTLQKRRVEFKDVSGWSKRVAGGFQDSR